MHNREAIEMMRRCADEIKQLRRRIDELAPKAEAYEVLKQVLGLLPRPSTGMGEDLVWRLEDRIQKLAKEEAAERVVPAKPTPETDDEFLERMAAKVGPLSEQEKAKALAADAVLKRELARARAEAGDEMVEDRLRAFSAFGAEAQAQR